MYLEVMHHMIEEVSERKKLSSDLLQQAKVISLFTFFFHVFSFLVSIISPSHLPLLHLSHHLISLLTVPGRLAKEIINITSPASLVSFIHLSQFFLLLFPLIALRKKAFTWRRSTPHLRPPWRPSLAQQTSFLLLQRLTAYLQQNPLCCACHLLHHQLLLYHLLPSHLSFPLASAQRSFTLI